VKAGLVALAVVVLVVVAAVGWAVSAGNDFVARDQAVREAWAQVQNVYQRRADLIPNLVETVKGFAAQERTVLEEVTRARASVAGMQVTPELLRDPDALRKFQEAQAQLGGALGRLLAVVERYPDLKSNQNFLALQNQLEGTENRIVVERRRYNEAVRGYNTAIRRFPGSVVASLRGFAERPYFEATAGTETPPAIKF
jgi:LemA protein